MQVINDPRVDKEIRRLPDEESARIVKVSELFAKHEFNLTEVHLKKLDRNLWELRSGHWRSLFGLVENKAIIVNLFRKKTNKTQAKEIDKALKRLQQYL